jgi:cytochrome P450
LLSQLLAVCPDGEGLSDEECAGVFRLLMHAGSETQGAAVSLGLLALIEHPLELDRVQRDRSLAPTALEEILRFTSPILHFRRTATRDTELRGVPIAAGEKVVVWYCSANFDEEVFEDPYRFDVGRSPNDHVALGAGGPHFCLGAALAQLELRVLLEEILERGLRFELCGPPRWGRPSFVHGLVSLPVRVRTRRHTSAGRR